MLCEKENSLLRLIKHILFFWKKSRKQLSLPKQPVLQPAPANCSRLEIHEWFPVTLQENVLELWLVRSFIPYGWDNKTHGDSQRGLQINLNSLW